MQQLIGYDRLPHEMCEGVDACKLLLLDASGSGIQLQALTDCTFRDDNIDEEMNFRVCPGEPASVSYKLHITLYS